MNIVRELRRKKGIQQKELAIAIGVSCPTVSAWESNKKDPSGERLQKLAKYFEVDELVILGKTVVDAANPNYFVPENPEVCGKTETEQIVEYVIEKLNVSPVQTRSPMTPEARIISNVVDKMPQSEREKALNIFKAAYSDYFDSSSEKMA